MTSPHFVLCISALLLGLSSAGCPAKEGNATASSASADASSPTNANPTAPASSSAPSSAAPAAPPAAPSPVDLEAMTWTEGDTTLTLSMQDLSKRCLLKGVSMVLPDKAQIRPMIGSRGCSIRAFGDDGPYIFIINDELNGKMPPKEELKGIKRTIEETADSWLIEDENPKTRFAGRATRKLGEHQTWCTGNANGKPNGEPIARGLVKLCATMTYTPPAK
jgi:hypothetical protein